MKKNFDIIISGVGGQGIITLTRILAQAALIDGYNVKTSELHGLSQRGGSVETHIRLGKNIFSPLVSIGKADLIFSLEMLEALRVKRFANKKTTFLINQYYLPFEGSPKKDYIIDNLNKVLGKKIFISASEVCEKELKNQVLSGIFMVSYASFKGIIPIKPESILKTIKKVVPAKYFEINKKAFELAKRQK